MPDPRFTKPWHGVPRESIDWHPSVDEDACIGCGTCVTGCNRLVYRFDFERKKAVVVDPLNCMVGCVTCSNTCPTHAISFPSLDRVAALEARPEVRHAIEDDLVARREQLAWHTRIPHADRLVQLVVEKIEEPNEDIRILTLAPKTEDDCLCQFVPGQYLEVWVPDRDWMSRAYSIGNAPRPDGRVELEIRRIPAGRFTGWAFESLEVGHELKVRGPLGNFTVRSPIGTPLVFVAGGSGFAPVEAMVEQQLSLGSERGIALFWGVEHSRDLYHLDRVERWTKESPGFSCTLAVREIAGGFESPAGSAVFRGDVAAALRSSGFDLNGRDAYVAGPPGMMHPVRQALVACGVDPRRIHVDAYHLQ